MAMFPGIVFSHQAVQLQAQMKQKICSSLAPQAEQSASSASYSTPMEYLQRKFCGSSTDDSALSSQAQSYLNDAVKWDIPTLETPQHSTHSQML